MGENSSVGNPVPSGPTIQIHSVWGSNPPRDPTREYHTLLNEKRANGGRERADEHEPGRAQSILL